MAETPERLKSALADRYTIERELGAGGMATVYLAHDVRHDRQVALKVLRPELSAILGGERFLAEIKTTANLQHPHILSLYDSGEAEGLVFYVMPFVEGESLRDRLTREKQLPVDEAVRIAREVADALDYAHRKGVVHRDIKPENILLHDGRAMVADFGIALAVSRSDGGTRMTETGMSLGTPHYMAPEQAMGEREITPKADVYALGCVLYEMLTGEPPYTGPTAQAIIARVMTEEPRSLTLQRRTIPPHVETAVQVALAKLPADRFATAAQFADALAGAAIGLPATRAGTAARAAVAAVPRWRRALPWAATFVVAAAGAWGWLRPQPQPTVSRQRINIWKSPVAAGNVSASAAISPDGRTLVYVDTAGGVRQLFAKERDQLETAPLAGTAGALGPTFSPDGQWIAFVADGRLKKVPRQGGSAITVADTANGFLPAIAWLENDTILYNNGTWDLMAVGAAGGRTRKVIAVDSIARGMVTVTGLPGGRGALVGTCTFGCPERELRVLDLSTGRLTVLGSDIVKGWFVTGVGVVFVRRDGGVFRAPFDLDTLGFQSPPEPVLDGVRVGSLAADMVLSPSGTLLYAAGGAQSTAPVEAVWVSREGRTVPVDSGWTYLPSANQGIVLSPDGSRLAVAIRTGSTDDIWIKQLDHGPLTRLTFPGTNSRPVWSRDGRTVFYVSSQFGGLSGNTQILARLADGTGHEDTVVRLTRQAWELWPIADTSRYLVRLGTPPSRDIVFARRGDTTAIPLVADPGYDEVAPTVSPDGRWLAYASNESGRYEVYVRPFPDVGSGRWQVSRNGGSEPTWAHNGRELFFRAANQDFVAAAVAPGPTFALGDQRVLFSAGPFWATVTGRPYSVAPDDSRFVFMRNVGSQTTTPTDLVLVEHWFTELNARR